MAALSLLPKGRYDKSHLGGWERCLATVMVYMSLNWPPSVPILPARVSSRDQTCGCLEVSTNSFHVPCWGADSSSQPLTPKEHCLKAVLTLPSEGPGSASLAGVGKWLSLFWDFQSLQESVRPCLLVLGVKYPAVWTETARSCPSIPCRVSKGHWWERMGRQGLSALFSAACHPGLCPAIPLQHDGWAFGYPGILHSPSWTCSSVPSV